MTTAEAFAPAKINLALHVTGQRADGYHLLDSLVVFAEIGDRLVLEPGTGLGLSVSGPFARGVPESGDNLVLRALSAAGWSGHVRLEKMLPHGAGIGSGSSDAAAVLRAVMGDGVLDRLGPDVVLALGADVPVCLHPGPQRMQGIGERLSRVPSVPALALVLVNPGVPVSTPAVFRALARKDKPEMTGVTGWNDLPAFVTWLSAQRNDLQQTAADLAPPIRNALGALDDALLARMSGSGATCFGIYRDRNLARRAAGRIAAAHPDWWVAETATAGSRPAP